MRHALALLTLVLFAVPAAAQPATVSLDDAVRGIEAEYGRMTDLKAEISQTSFNKMPQPDDPRGGAGLSEEGWQAALGVHGADQQVIVSDGKTIWLYTPQLNQVNTGPAPEALAGPGRLVPERSRQAARALQRAPAEPAQPKDAEGNVVLDLTPKRPLPTLNRLILSFDPNGWQLRKGRRLRPVREHGDD